MERFRFNDATGDVYEWSDSAKAYIFIGNLCGRSHRQFIDHYLDKEEIGDDYVQSLQGEESKKV